MKKDDKVFKSLIHNYRSLEQSIVKQLYFETEHGTTIGTFREAIWKSLFEQIIPKKFIVEQSVFIVDSEGRVSNEVDLAIIDELYTPYIFRQGHLKFIPIEAVAVAVECKSSSSDEGTLKKWGDSIRYLKTSNRGIARMYADFAMASGPTQTATRPLLIYCHLDKANICAKQHFDITLHAKKSCDIELFINPKVDKLEDMYRELNHNQTTSNTEGKYLGEKNYNNLRIKDKGEVTLLSLNFVLNQTLMLINNPMLFPHLAYAELFQEKWKEIEGEEQ